MLTARLDTVPAASRDRLPAVAPLAMAEPANREHVLLGDALAGFEPLSLGDLERVALLSRQDTKYLAPAADLAAALPLLARDYTVLTVDGINAHRYRSLYFDSAGLALYHAHRREVPHRYKVRSRSYLDTGLSYFEVKERGAAGRTTKWRCPTGSLLERLGPAEIGFAGEHIGSLAAVLEPTLDTVFTRVTLAHRTHPERLTVDFDLALSAAGRVCSLPGLAVIESKRAHGGRPGAAVLRQALNLHPVDFSKYCSGVALLYAPIPGHKFLPSLVRAHHLSQDGMRGLSE